MKVHPTQTVVATMALSYQKYSEVHAGKKRGQALVEWIVVGSAIMVFWSAAMVLANRLLLRTAIEQWSLVAARQALSNAKTIHITGLTLQKNTTFNKGTAKVFLTRKAPYLWDQNKENANVRTTIALPTTNGAQSWLDSLPFGYPFSLFSE